MTGGRFPDGKVLLLPPSRAMIRGRPIVGDGPTVFVPPEAFHGLWIEMRE